LIKFGVFYNKNKILTILFIVKFEKITLLIEQFLVLLGHIISRFLHVQMRGRKINQNNKACVLWSYLYGSTAVLLPLLARFGFE
jgi:hypothetical protein